MRIFWCKKKDYFHLLAFLTVSLVLLFTVYLFYSKTENNSHRRPRSTEVKKGNEDKSEGTTSPIAEPSQALVVETIKPLLSPTFSLTDFYEVHRVVDGDTFEIRINDQIKKVRVIGINAPELSDYRKRVRCFAEEALKKAKELLSGRRVRLEIDPTQGDLDKFKRLLRFVFLEDGSDYGFLMIKEGFAYEYTYLFPHRHQDQYRQAQKKAQEERKGLWSEETCSY